MADAHSFFLVTCNQQISRVFQGRVWHANRKRLLPRLPGPVPFGTCKCSTRRDHFSQAFRNSPVPFFTSSIPRCPFDFTTVWDILFSHSFDHPNTLCNLVSFDRTYHQFIFNFSSNKTKCVACSQEDAYTLLTFFQPRKGLAYFLHVERKLVLKK